MKPWPSVGVPTLPGDAEPLQLFDTATQHIQPLDPSGTARMYVCGITPYDATHLGHASTFIAFDLVSRVWRDGGHDLIYVQNVTDVDDPLLERARSTGEDWTEVAERETALFAEDMVALRVLPPTHFVGAVESIPDVVALVERLRARTAAYRVAEDTYFHVGSAETFGEVSGLDRASMLAQFAERGGDPERVGKDDPLDCLLWQAERAGEPAWETALGRGRPGWHIECTAIALKLLGSGFDLQGGGRDLMFPHHEMCAAQARVLTGESFARRYAHAGLVGLDGEKMSKSRGNLVFVSQLRADGVDPMAIRLALLAHHYRTDWEWTKEELDDATQRLSTWRRAAAAASGPNASVLLQQVRHRLADDLDAPAALRAVDAWAADTVAGRGGDPESGALGSRTVDALLGIRL